MEGYLLIFFVLLARSYSLPDNDTSIHAQNHTDFSKRGFGSVGSAQVLPTRKSTVIVSKLAAFLQNKIMKYGTIKITIWNKAQRDIQDAKWKHENLEMESLPLRTAESEMNPVEIVANYKKIVVLSQTRTLWISYRLSLTHRICIYVKEQTIFQYTVYVTGMHSCDEPERPPDNVFVSENEGNGYKSYWQHVTAECAMDSHKDSHLLNVYILSVDEILPTIPHDGKLQAWTEQTQMTNPDLNPVLPENENEGQDIESQTFPSNQLGGSEDVTNQQPSEQPILLPTVSPFTTMVPFTTMMSGERNYKHRIFMDSRLRGRRPGRNHGVRMAPNSVPLRRFRPMVQRRKASSQFRHQQRGNEYEIPENYHEMIKNINGNNHGKGMDEVMNEIL